METPYDLESQVGREKSLRESFARAIVPEIQPHQATGFIVEHLATSEYKADVDESNSDQADHVFEENSELWHALFREDVHANTIVKLSNFTLTEWVPRSPGTFHTHEALDARNEAWRHRLSRDDFTFNNSFDPPISNTASFDWGQRNVSRPIRHARNIKRIDRASGDEPVVFSPDGKLSMIQGGVGCVRLQPIELRQENFWLWGASSSKVVHEGFPIAIRDVLYNKFVDAVVSGGGLTCDLIGQIRYIRPSGRLEYGQRVPRCYLEVEAIKPRDVSWLEGARRLRIAKSAKPAPCLVCVAVSFENGDKELLATYASFESGSRESFERAIEWMDKEYVGRLYGGRIITDFDEKASPFSDVLFSLKDVMNGRVSKESSNLILAIRQDYHAEIIARAVERARSITIERVASMTTKVIKIGDNATISAPVTIADTIQNSFNAIQSMPDQGELKSLLDRFIKSVAEVSPKVSEKTSRDLARDADDIVREASGEEPRSEVCQTLLERVAKTAKAVGSVAEPLSNCVSALSSFFSGGSSQ